tara:strand:+ start:204 stop:4457 length:4254 start_codon:yes stop_codon:yes gene_type:complete
MSSKFFDFNLPDGSLPEDIVLVDSGSNDKVSGFEVQDNKLVATELANAATFGSGAGYDTGSMHGVVRGRFYLNGHDALAMAIRMLRVYQCIQINLSSIGEVKAVKRSSDEAILISSTYTIPNFDPNLGYEIEAHMRGPNIEVFVEGQSALNFVEDSGYTYTVHGIKGPVGVAVDDLFVGDTSSLPLIGSAPQLTVSGEAYTKVNVGQPIPEFEGTAVDSKDGVLPVTVEGSIPTNEVEGIYTLKFSTIDSDYNETVETRVVEYVAKPILEFNGGRTHYTISQGQPFKPPVVVYNEVEGYQGQVTPTGWSDANRNIIGSYELTYSHTGQNGETSDPIVVTVDVVARPEITDTGPFSMVQEYGASRITVDGYELKRYDSPDGESWSYGFENDTVVLGSDINKISNQTTNTVEVARIKIPFDSLARCVSSTVRIDIQTDNFVEGSRIEVSFGEYRQATQYRVTKDVQSQRTVVEFEIKPFHDSSFRVYGLGNGKDPDRIFSVGNTHDWHLSTDTHLIVYFKFGDITPAANILAINAQARVGKAKFFEDGEHFLNGKDHFNIAPFRADDPVNKELPANVVTKSTFLTDNKTDINANHFTTVAGSEWVTVADTSGIEVGDIPFVVLATPPEDATITRFSIAESDIVKLSVGYARYIAEVDHANSRFRMNHPAVGDYDSSVDGLDYLNRYMCIATAHPEIVSLVFANIANSWRESPINGTDKLDTKNNNNASKVHVVELENSEPLTKFKFSYMLPQNNFTAPFAGDDFEAINYGERIANGEFSLPLPEGWSPSNYSNSNNADRNFLFILPNKTYALHTYLTYPENEDGFVTCSRLTGHDLSQWSVAQIQWRLHDSRAGRTNSSRASGFSAANVIRKAELDKITVRGYTEADIDADLDVAENAIQHALTGYLSQGQMMSTTFLYDLDDVSNETPYFIHEPFHVPIKIVNGGTGYARGDTVELTCPIRTDSHTATVYAVEAVNQNGSILKAIVTRNGQHTKDPSEASHSPFKTSGNGTGAVFDTTGMFTQSHNLMHPTSYPAAIADGGFLASYAGAVPMGGVMTIDPNIDLRARWKAAIMRNVEGGGQISNAYSYEFYAICCAIKKYGWILCDASTITFPPLILEGTIFQSPRKDRVLDSPGTSYSYRNIRRLRSMMVPVHNFTPTHHLETDVDLAPVLEITAGDDIVVPPNWRDPKCFALSPLYGDLSDQVTVDKEFDFTTLEPQEFYYSVTDKDGRTTTVGPRRVTVDIPQPVAEAGPDLTLKAGEPFKLQGYGAPSLDSISITSLEWTQLEGDSTSLSDRFIENPTGIAPSAIAEQTLVYQLKVIDENGLEATDTVSIQVAALEGRSAFDITIPDAPDGSAWAVITDSSNRRIFSDNVNFINGVAKADQLPVDAGELVRGTVDVGDTLDSAGTGFKGITYAI